MKRHTAFCWVYFFVMLSAVMCLQPATITPTLKDFSEKSRTEFFLSELKVAQNAAHPIAQITACKRIFPLVTAGVADDAKETLFSFLEMLWSRRVVVRDFDLAFYEVITHFLSLPLRAEQKEKLERWSSLLRKEMENYAVKNGSVIVIARSSRPAFLAQVRGKESALSVQFGEPRTAAQKLSGLFKIVVAAKQSGASLAAGDEVLLKPLFSVAETTVLPLVRELTLTLHGDAVALMPLKQATQKHWKIEAAHYSVFNHLPYLLQGQSIVFKSRTAYLGFGKTGSFSMMLGEKQAHEEAFTLRVCTQHIKTNLENTIIGAELRDLEGQSDEKALLTLSRILGFVDEHTLLAHRTALAKKLVILMENCRNGKNTLCRSIRYLAFQMLATPAFEFHSALLQSGLRKMNELLSGYALKNNDQVTMRMGSRYLAVVPGSNGSYQMNWLPSHDKRLRDGIHLFRIHVEGSEAKGALAFSDSVRIVSCYGGADHHASRLSHNFKLTRGSQEHFVINPPALNKALSQRLVLVSGDVVIVASQTPEKVEALSCDDKGAFSFTSLVSKGYRAPREAQCIIELVSHEKSGTIQSEHVEKLIDSIRGQSTLLLRITKAINTVSLLREMCSASQERFIQFVMSFYASRASYSREELQMLRTLFKLVRDSLCSSRLSQSKDLANAITELTFFDALKEAEEKTGKEKIQAYENLLHWFSKSISSTARTLLRKNVEHLHHKSVIARH